MGNAVTEMSWCLLYLSYEAECFVGDPDAAALPVLFVKCPQVRIIRLVTRVPGPERKRGGKRAAHEAVLVLVQSWGSPAGGSTLPEKRGYQASDPFTPGRGFEGGQICGRARKVP